MSAGHVVSLKQLQDRWVDALVEIRDGWTDMLPTMPPAITYSAGFGSGARTSTAKGEDNGDHNADVSNLDVLLSDRADVAAVLSGWAENIATDWQVSQRAPLRTDVLGLCEFLIRWAVAFSGHPGFEAALEEVRECAHLVGRHVAPFRREWLGLGPCPLRDEEGRPCQGMVRARPRASDRDGEVMARCTVCEVDAVATWWEARMFGGREDDEHLLTASEVVLLVHKTFGRLVTEATVRQWCTRGVVEAAGKDDRGRTLYSRDAIVYALARREQWSTISS